ncbi:class I SAM-dependent methyltransferase [Dyadobacter sp. 32]|uniref:class I SAM-dependent methyltransferase n=1 Tax=Dyadobacter sp. 32 TaxID=538966 RepID=UPI0011EE2398
MNISDAVEHFSNTLHGSLQNNSFSRLSLGNYKGPEENLKNIYVKKAVIRREEKLSFTYRYKTRDIVKNHGITEGEGLVNSYIQEGFLTANLFTTELDLLLEIQKTGKVILKQSDPSSTTLPSKEHDKNKIRPISPTSKPYLHDLNITDTDGHVFKKSQDKYKQINHYIDLLSPLIRDIPATERLSVVDMGSGKGYLTFALYDYLTSVLNMDAEITGVEFRPDLVALCNSIARKSNFGSLRFEEGTIENYQSDHVDILIALHACDTATDDAIHKGITGNADLIVVAPCCHKQIRRQIEKAKVNTDVDFLTRYGIFLERQAEMVTDGLRAMILEYFGYKTKVIEFISDAHTPKNVMIVGQKQRKLTVRDPKILQKIKTTKAYFGIEMHHLEKMMGI